MDDLVIRPQTPPLRYARAVLAALTRRPGLAALPAVEALATLDLVQPPYPPVEELPDDTAVGDDDALDALAAAVQQAADPAEAARLVDAAESLRTPAGL